MVAAPVMVVSMLLELMECERSWIAKALFCTGMSVYIPVYENGHYCAASCGEPSVPTELQLCSFDSDLKLQVNA